MSVYDESPRWSDESVSDPDDAAEMTIRRPLFENNFLQRWIERDGEESEHDDDDEEDEDSPKGSITKRFRSTFKRLFPKLAETSKSASDTAPTPAESTTNRTEATSRSQQVFSEVEVNIPHVHTELAAERIENTNDSVEDTEESRSRQTANVANETIVHLHEDAQIAPQVTAEVEPVVLQPETHQADRQEQKVESTRAEHIAVPLAAVASSEIANPNKREVQPEIPPPLPAQKSETKTLEKPQTESWYQRFRRKRKERKVIRRLESLEKQVNSLEHEGSRLRKENVVLEKKAFEQNLTQSRQESDSLQAAARHEDRRDRASIVAEDSPKIRPRTPETPPRQKSPETENIPEKQPAKLSQEKTKENTKNQREERAPDYSERTNNRLEKQPDLEIVDDNVREADFDKRHEIMDAQIDDKLRYERLGPPDELPPLAPAEKPLSNNKSEPTPISSILEKKKPLKREGTGNESHAKQDASLSYIRATTAGFVLALTIAVIGLIAYVLTS